MRAAGSNPDYMLVEIWFLLMPEKTALQEGVNDTVFFRNCEIHLDFTGNDESNQLFISI